MESAVVKNKEKEKSINHCAIIDNKNKISVTAVIEVVSAQDNCVSFKTEAGAMQVQGSSLRVEKLSLEEKLLILEGNISTVKYVGDYGKKNFFAKLFK